MDIGVVRAVRLWFSPLGGEIPIDIIIKENDVKLGFAISRTEEVTNFYLQSRSVQFNIDYFTTLVYVFNLLVCQGIQLISLRS